MAKKEKKQKKVRCAECKAQYQGFCTTKRVKVSINKNRHCDKFRFDQSRVKVKEALPTTRLSYREQEEQRKQQKADLKLLRKMLKEEGRLDTKGNLIDPPPESRIYKPYGNEKFPLTGDLSRFTTTGTEGDEDEQEDS